jgi:hypothetical protein
MVSDVAGIILFEIEIHLLKLGTLQLSFSVADPSLCEKRSAIQIIVVDVERRAVELQSDETVVTHVDVFVCFIAAVVIEDAVAIDNVRKGVAVDRHASMADATPEGLNSASRSKAVVDSKSVLMPPEPENGPFGRNNVSQLLCGYRIPIIEA